MRSKIDYGIDLGTTNSAVARMENGIPTIIKSDTLKDTIPSCVNFNKKQDILIGDIAFNVMKNDRARALKTLENSNTNTFIEFKRTMGTSHTYECSNMKRDYSSEELSAEVLKKIKSFIQDENFTSVVITVPAKFLNPQNEATMKAAKMAGFKHVELLQEPVAAATAYGLSSQSKDGYWLVFDFGGGTFDAAILKSEEGILSVKDTDGDNWLGGKNIDEAIVDQLIIPSLAKDFSISSLLKDGDQKELLRNAVKYYAEEAKIQLSFKASHNILSNLGDLPLNDEDGNELEIDILVTQKDLADIVAPIFQKAINICKELLKRNNLIGSDIGALILVGGPTYSPILRNMLKEQITEKVDTSVDPMTVVAKGAALFASTISVSEEVKDQNRDKTKLQLEIKHQSTSVETDEMVNLKIQKSKTSGLIPSKVFAEIIRFDGAWSSGKKLIGEKATLFEVLLVEGRSNSFEVKVYDDQGNKLDCQPNQFSILHGIGGLEGMQVLPYHIGIGKYFADEDKDLFKPATGLEKSKKVPAVGVINGLKTRNTIRPGIAGDVIRIPIYQGSYNADGTNPILNNFISEVIITGESLPGLLPVGSDVDVTIKVDSSQIMQFSAYFPLLDHTEELKVEINGTKPPSENELRLEITKAEKAAQGVNAENISNNLKALEEQLENEKGSADGKMKILDGLRKELLQLDVLEKASNWPKVEQRLKDTFYELEELIEKIKSYSKGEDLNMDKVEAHVKEYKNSIEHVIVAKDIKEAKRLTSEIDSMDFNLRNAVSGNALDVEYLTFLDAKFALFDWKDPNKARLLINQGLKLTIDENTSGIRPLLIQVIALMPEDQKPKETLA